MSPDRHEVRFDPIHGWPVIYAPPRARRPISLSVNTGSNSEQVNPFAEHSEHLTTPERFAIRAEGTQPNQPGWRVRIIPNKYPVLVTPDPADPACLASGYHDVIVESPQPVEVLTELDEEQFQQIFLAYQMLIQEMRNTPGIAQATIFKNQGRAAGASQPHVHSQAMATTFVPPAIQREVNYAQQLWQSEGVDYYQNLLERELAHQQRIVFVNDSAVVLCPEVSRFACEMHLIPLTPSARFEDCESTLVQETASLMRRALLALQNLTGSTAFNYVLHSAPFAGTTPKGFRWHWEIYPRLSGIAGWELGQESFVNPVFPETAARLLRGN